jgi:hypothetical protein
MEKNLKSFLLIAFSILFGSMSCENDSPKIESDDFQFFHHVPGSCPTYYFNTLDSHIAHIPTETSHPIIEALLKDHPNAAKVRISLKKTGKTVQHYCGDREANPKLHPFIEIEILSITEI